MIRYEITPAKLNEITTKYKNWFDRAKIKTDNLIKAGTFNDSSPIWSEIKPALIEIQHRKCAYCERKFSEWPIEWDIEHFRPKGFVKAWPTPEMIEKLGLQDCNLVGDEYPNGYYALAYQFSNYLLSCKVCNSNFKHDFFPIFGARGSSSERISDTNSYAQEQPCLIYPLGDLDDNPEDLITFSGILAIPAYLEGDEYRRAKITIQFFGLSSPEREELFSERARKIVLLYFLLRILESENVLLRDQARSMLDKELAPGSPHCSCGRAFYRLYQSDRSRAQEIFQYAKKLDDEYSR